jgi:hypothetical protein
MGTLLTDCHQLFHSHATEFSNGDFGTVRRRKRQNYRSAATNALQLTL